MVISQVLKNLDSECTSPGVETLLFVRSHSARGRRKMSKKFFPPILPALAPPIPLPLSCDWFDAFLPSALRVVFRPCDPGFKGGHCYIVVKPLPSFPVLAKVTMKVESATQS